MFLLPVVTGAYPEDVVADLAAAGAPLPVQDGDLEVIGAPLDWLGVDCYFEQTVRAGTRPDDMPPTSFIGGRTSSSSTPRASPRRWAGA